MPSQGVQKKHSIYRAEVAMDRINEQGVADIEDDATVWAMWEEPSAEDVGAQMTEDRWRSGADELAFRLGYPEHPQYLVSSPVARIHFLAIN